MVDNINQNLTAAVPCALKNCLPHEHDAPALAALIQNKQQQSPRDGYGQAQWVTPASDTSLLFEKTMPVIASPHVRELDYPAHPPRSTPHNVCSDRSVTAVNVQSRNSGNTNDVIDSKNQTVNPPVSLIQGSPKLSKIDTRAPSPKTSPVSTANLHSYTPMYARRSFDGPQLPLKHPQGTSVPPLPTYNAAESPSNEGKPKSHAYIADLCDAVRAMSKEWIRRLAVSTHIPQLYPEQYARALFELGIRALRNYFRGAAPSSFQDIFALIHVAMAISYIIGENNLAYSWDTLLEEVCQWQHLLSNVIERRIFVKAITRLCRPQGSSTSSVFKDCDIDGVLLPAEHETLVRLVGHLSSTYVNETIQEEVDKDRQHSTIDNAQNRLPGMLQSDVMIEGCTNFLDNFGHAVIVEDLTNRQIKSSWYIAQHLPGIDTLDSNIIGRLQEWKGLEAFRGVVTETQKMLRGGLLHSARDVEVILICSGKSYSKSPQLLRRYLNVVKDLCDTVMGEWGPQWRNRFYEIILGTVLATASEFSRYQGRALQTRPVTPFGSLNISYEVDTMTANATMPPADLDASSSFSPCTFQVLSTPSVDASYCPDPSCKASFTGSSQRTNLERHLRTALHHNQEARFKCEVCRVTFSRPDNLQQHLRNIHGLDPASKGQRESTSPTQRGVGG